MTHLAIVDADAAANHLWDDYHIAQMSLDDRRLLVGECLFFCFAELFNEAHGTAIQTTLEPAPGASMDKLIKWVWNDGWAE